MNARAARRIAAGATALALAGLGLIGFGATAASAVDTVPSSPAFGGTFYLADGSLGTDFAPGADQIPFNLPTLALKAPGDLDNPVAADPAAWGATQAWDFLSPIGQETTKSAWNAYTSTIMAANGQLQENTFPNGLLNAGTGNPSGQAAVAAAGGDYSLGIAYTSNSGVTIVKVIYVHIHVTAGTTSTATYTYEPVQAAVVKTATTTTLSSSASTVNTGEQFTLTATVAPAAASGSVEFFSGTTSLGTAPVASGTATLATASLATAGANSITAVYSGDTAYSGSTSAAVTVTANLAPIATTTSVSATSSDNVALHPVTLSATVAPATAVGTVTFTGTNPAVAGGAVQALGSNVAVSSGVASITTTGLAAGTWTIDAAFTGTSPYVASASTTAATLTLTAAAYDPATPDPQNVDVVIPTGSLVITTPWTSAAPLHLGNAVLDSATSTWNSDSDSATAGYQPTVFGSATDQSKAIQVVDTRAGDPGFTAQVASSAFVNGGQSFPASYLGLVNVAAHDVANNQIKAVDVHTTDVPSLSASAQTFATYHPATMTLGTAWISGDLSLKNVPTSIQPGTYTATLTFTAF